MLAKQPGRDRMVAIVSLLIDQRIKMKYKIIVIEVYLTCQRMPTLIVAILFAITIISHIVMLIVI